MLALAIHGGMIHGGLLPALWQSRNNTTRKRRLGAGVRQRCGGVVKCNLVGLASARGVGGLATVMCSRIRGVGRWPWRCVVFRCVVALAALAMNLAVARARATLGAAAM